MWFQLNGCNTYPSLVKNFSETMKTLKCLRILQITNTTNDMFKRIVIGGEDMEVFAKFLEKNDSLVNLHIENCSITSVDLVVLFKALEKNTVLKNLKIAEEGKSIEDTKALVNLL